MDFGQPGFTDEAFAAIAFRVKEPKRNKSDVICSLMVYELPIRKHLEWDGHRLLGFTDIDNGIEDDFSAFACEALTFMAVSINSNWKNRISVSFCFSALGIGQCLSERGRSEKRRWGKGREREREII